MCGSFEKPFRPQKQTFVKQLKHFLRRGAGESIRLIHIKESFVKNRLSIRLMSQWLSWCSGVCSNHNQDQIHAARCLVTAMFLRFICAVVTRSLFILISLIGMWRVIWVKNNKLYWLLTILFLPLLVETILTLRRRKGKDCKWFSPAIFLFLISIVPSIWILELHHQHNKLTDAKCNRLNSSESIKKIFNNWKNNDTTNGTDIYKFIQDSEKLLSSVCPNDWILALHQSLLVLLIVGKWLMPNEGTLTRDELSQLLLIFVGTAADILEFTSETLSDVKDKSPLLVYIILAIWTWSMLQFPHNLTVLSSKTEEYETQTGTLFSRHRTDFWAVIETLLIQDGPFLVVRLTVMMHFEIVHQMLVFFAIKNFLVVALNVYRLWVIYWDSRS